MTVVTLGRHWNRHKCDLLCPRNKSGVRRNDVVGGASASMRPGTAMSRGRRRRAPAGCRACSTSIHRLSTPRAVRRIDVQHGGRPGIVEAAVLGAEAFAVPQHGIRVLVPGQDPGIDQPRAVDRVPVPQPAIDRVGVSRASSTHMATGLTRLATASSGSIIGAEPCAGAAPPIVISTGARSAKWRNLPATSSIVISTGAPEARSGETSQPHGDEVSPLRRADARLRPGSSPGSVEMTLWGRRATHGYAPDHSPG